MSDVLNSTLRRIVDRERDLLFRTTPILAAASDLGGIDTDAPGASLSLPVVVQDHATITNFAGSGFAPYNLVVQDSLGDANYQYAMNGIPALISKKELLKNSGPLGRVKLADQRIRQVRAAFGRAVEQQLQQGGVAALSDWSSLYGGFSVGTAVADGFLYAGATATDGGTVGGLARSTAIGLQNQRVSISGGDIGDAITLAANEADVFTEMGGDQRALFMSGTTRAALEQETNDLVRYANSTEIDAGVQVMMFRGQRVYTSGYMPDVSTTGVQVHGVSFDGIKLYFAPGEDFRLNRYERIPGTETEIASITVFGQLAASHVASSFVIVT